MEQGFEENSYHLIVASLIFGCLPGRWMGYDEGRKTTPSLAEEGWDKCLRSTGFSEVDAIVPTQKTISVPLAVISSQSMDDQITMLRSPSTIPVERVFSDLLIVGGSTKRVSELIKPCARYLGRFYKNITLVTSFEDLVATEAPLRGTVLNLCGWDDTIFKDMTADKLEAISAIKDLFWITQGCRHNDPFQNMSLGLGRTISLEMPHFRLQLLDFYIEDQPTSDIVSTRLLEHEIYESLEQTSQHKLLWSIEPEAAIENGNYLTPCLLRQPIRNARYNSIRRFITKDLKPHHRASESWVIARLRGEDAMVTCQVKYSTIHAIKVTSQDYAYLVSDIDTRTKGLYSSGQTLVLLEPKRAFPIVVSQVASEKGIRTVFLTTEADTKGQNWIYMHPNAPKRVTRATLPRKVTCFITNAEHEVAVEPSVVEVQELSPESQPAKNMDFFSWSDNLTVPVEVTPVDHAELFSPHITYWLVGLSGGLGLSLCNFETINPLVVVQGQDYLYSQSDVQILADSYKGLVKAFAKFPASTLTRPALYDITSTRHAHDIGRGISKFPQWPVTLVHRIDHISSKYGPYIALESGLSTLTYHQMCQRVNSIATTLSHSHHLGTGSRVGGFQDTTTDFYCTLLAILRIGAIFIPLESRLQTPRIAPIIKDSAIDAVLFETANQADMKALGNAFKIINVSAVTTTASRQITNSAVPD
ncbi:hypothetical protein NHQ30_001586 [Ciborinia camelliae]|nr:hypothetical protein NHQ30_001586 [Ciborinia camelliae]